jgi:hypothetical protein
MVRGRSEKLPKEVGIVVAHCQPRAGHSFKRNQADFPPEKFQFSSGSTKHNRGMDSPVEGMQKLQIHRKPQPYASLTQIGGVLFHLAQTPHARNLGDQTNSPVANSRTRNEPSQNRNRWREQAVKTKFLLTAASQIKVLCHNI